MVRVPTVSGLGDNGRLRVTFYRKRIVVTCQVMGNILAYLGGLNLNTIKVVFQRVRSREIKLIGKDTLT